MIKWIKSLIEKIFGKKEEPVILEDEEKYLAEEKALADYAESFKEKKIKKVCEKHPDTYKKTCPSCREAANG